MTAAWTGDVELRISVTDFDSLTGIEVPGFKIYVVMEDPDGDFFDDWSWQSLSDMIAANIVALMGCGLFCMFGIWLELKFECIGKKQITEVKRQARVAQDLIEQLKPVAAAMSGKPKGPPPEVAAAEAFKAGGKRQRQKREKAAKATKKVKKGKKGKKGDAGSEAMLTSDARDMAAAGLSGPPPEDAESDVMSAQNAAMAMMLAQQMAGNQQNAGGAMGKLQMLASVLGHSGGRGGGATMDSLSELTGGMAMSAMAPGMAAHPGNQRHAGNTAYMNPMLGESDAELTAAGIESHVEKVALDKVHKGVEQVAVANFGGEAGMVIATAANKQIDEKEVVAKKKVKTKAKAINQRSKKSEPKSEPSNATKNPMMEDVLED